MTAKMKGKFSSNCQFFVPEKSVSRVCSKKRVWRREIEIFNPKLIF